jgi:hypothetical protein
MAADVIAADVIAADPLNQQQLNQLELNQQQTLPFSATKPNAGDLTDPPQDQQPTRQRQITEMNAPQRRTQQQPGRV